MTDGTTTITLPGDAPTAVELLLAVRGCDVDLVRRLLSDGPDLARARFEAGGGSGTALHFVTDRPGYFPNGPDIEHLLIDAGADPNALTTGGGSKTPGPGSETPLHDAASSDDVDVVEIDGAPVLPRRAGHRIHCSAASSLGRPPVTSTSALGRTGTLSDDDPIHLRIL